MSIAVMAEKEYIVWRVLDGVIDYFALNEGRYDGCLQPKAFIKASPSPVYGSTRQR